MSMLCWARDSFVALLSTVFIYVCGLYLGLGVLIALDASYLPQFLFDYVSYLVLLVSALFVIAARQLGPSAGGLKRVMHDSMLLFAAMLLGSWIGLESQYFTLPHGVEDLGLYDGPGQAGVLALGLLLRRSTRPGTKRVGTIVIVLAALVLTGWAEEFVQYSRAVSRLSLTVGEKSLLKMTGIVLLFLAPALTATVLVRRSH
jgi:hypothetical protein